MALPGGGTLNATAGAFRTYVISAIEKHANFMKYNFNGLTVLLVLMVKMTSFAQDREEVSKRPNIVMIVSDDLAACLGSYNNKVCQTPNLDRLAREGVRFENAHCQFPVCGASRASFMSGMYPAATKMLGNSKTPRSYKSSNPALENHPSMAGMFRSHGYYSARISKIYHMGVPGGIEAGVSEGDEPDSWDWACNILGAESYSQGAMENLSPGQTAWGTKFATIKIADQREASQTDFMAANQAVAFLENRSKEHGRGESYAARVKAGAPFFLAVGFVRPHVPLVAPERLFNKYPDKQMVLPKVPPGDLDDLPAPAKAMRNAGRYDMSEDGQRKAIAGYYASVSFMDEQVGRVLEALDRLELRRNTIVVFTSDHGYNLGEHECWQKLSLFAESTRVPLIIAAPGMKQSAGKSALGMVELVDLYPTLADLAGLADQVPKRVQGVSLRPLLEEPARTDWAKQQAYTVTHQGGESVRTERWRYSIWGKGGEELYDLANDPGEFKNLAGDAGHDSVLKELRQSLEQCRHRASQY